MNGPGAATSYPPRREKKRVNINTSLSTLSPAHYEAMNTVNLPVPAGTHGRPNLTKRDIVKWKQEEAFELGELGLTTNFHDPSDIFKPFTINQSFEYEPPAENHAALVGAMKETHNRTMQLRQRQILMDGNRPLLASTEMDINQNLLAAGVPEQELPHKNLRQKIVQLVELTKPSPKENFAAVLVNVASTTKGRSHNLEVNLPLGADVAEVYALLAEVVKALLSEKGLSYEGRGSWKYQLVDQSQSQLLMDKSLPLETDLDYKQMLQQLSRVGDGNAAVAVLTQVRRPSYIQSNILLAKSTCSSLRKQDGLARPIAMSEGNANAQDPKAREDSPSDVPEVLDEDGQPFFEPHVDMDRMCEKYADFGDDLTEENGIHGFWR